MANTKDMRYVRTEEAIRAAFMELVAEGSVSSLTASALCRRAGISRNAFYLHHSSVGELYSALVDELVEDIRAESVASAERIATTGGVDAALPHAIVGAFAKHEKLLRALLPADGGALVKQLAEGLENAYMDAALLVGRRGASFEHQMNCAFTAWAHVGLMARWIAETDRPIEESLPVFEALQMGLSESITRFLIAEA